jgi:hypothetical protein
MKNAFETICTQPEMRVPAGKTVEAMKELVNARDALAKDRVAALNRQAIAVSPSSGVSSLRGCARSMARSKRSTNTSKCCGTQTQTSASASTS